MKIVKFVFLILLVCQFASLAAEGTSAKYITKYKSSEYSDTVNCFYDEEKNEYLHKLNDKIIQIYKYNSKNEFIKERNSFGLSFYISFTLNSENLTDTAVISYDGEKLLQEKGAYTIINWNKWDKKNRNTAGEIIFTGSPLKIPVKAVYDDKLKTMTVKFTYPGDFLEKYPDITIEFVKQFDDFNNIIRVTNKKYNKKITEEIYTEIEYTEIK